MSSQEVALLTTVIQAILKVGGWPAALLITMFLGPWIMALLLVLFLERGHSRRIESITDNQNKRIEAIAEQHREVSQMYKNNVVLVESVQQLAGRMDELIMINTRAMTRLEENIEKNWFCPIVRDPNRGQS